MSAYQDVYLAILQILQNFLGLPSRTGSRQVVHANRQVFQSRLKRLVVLVSQYSGRYQHSHLL